MSCLVSIHLLFKDIFVWMLISKHPPRHQLLGLIAQEELAERQVAAH